jgi:hypothetical protein
LNKGGVIVVNFGCHITQYCYNLKGGVHGFFRKGAPGFVTRAYLFEGHFYIIQRYVSGWWLLIKVQDKEVGKE